MRQGLNPSRAACLSGRRPWPRTSSRQSGPDKWGCAPRCLQHTHRHGTLRAGPDPPASFSTDKRVASQGALPASRGIQIAHPGMSDTGRTAWWLEPAGLPCPGLLTLIPRPGIVGEAGGRPPVLSIAPPKGAEVGIAWGRHRAGLGAGLGLRAGHRTRLAGLAAAGSARTRQEGLARSGTRRDSGACTSVKLRSKHSKPTRGIPSATQRPESAILRPALQCDSQVAHPQRLALHPGAGVPPKHGISGGDGAELPADAAP